MITFTQGGQLRFVDPRTFGEMFVTEYDEIEKQVDGARAPRARPARDRDVVGLLRPACSPSGTTKLKPLLMDQKFIAGIGNIYSDEILFEAGLRWDRMSDSLVAAGGAAAVPRDHARRCRTR